MTVVVVENDTSSMTCRLMIGRYYCYLYALHYHSIDWMYIINDVIPVYLINDDYVRTIIITIKRWGNIIFNLPVKSLIGIKTTR